MYHKNILIAKSALSMMECITNVAVLLVINYGENCKKWRFSRSHKQCESLLNG